MRATSIVRQRWVSGAPGFGHFLRGHWVFDPADYRKYIVLNRKFESCNFFSGVMMMTVTMVMMYGCDESWECDGDDCGDDGGAGYNGDDDGWWL